MLDKLTHSDSWQQFTAYVRKSDLFPRRFGRSEQRLVIQAIIVGLVAWAIVFFMRMCVRWIFHYVLAGILRAPSVVFVLVPLVIGAVITASIVLYRMQMIYYRDKTGHLHELIDLEGDGFERAISLYYATEPSFEQALLGQEGVAVRWEMPTFSLGVRKFAATLSTLGSGGSGGLEASAALIGENVAATLFKPRNTIDQISGIHPGLDKLKRWWGNQTIDSLQTAQLSGIAAAITVLIGAPFTAAFFTSEVMYRRRPLIEKLIFSLIAALVSYFMSTLVTGHAAVFNAERTFLPPTTLRYYGLISLMAIAIAFVSIYFTRSLRWLDHTMHHRLPNIYVRQMTGAAITGLVAIAVVMINNHFGLASMEESLRLVLSTSDGAVDMALAGQIGLALAAVVLVAKMLAVQMTIASGGSSGLLIPALYYGAMVAVIFAKATGSEPMTLIVPAMTASLISIVSVPMAAIMLPVELFSSHYIVPAMFVLVICTLLTQEDKIYRTQQETFQQRQIAPGVDVRRAKIPPQWAGSTLVDLDFRRKYEATVIGVLDVSNDEGKPQVRLKSAANVVLQQGDTLIVIGEEEQLETLQDEIDALFLAADPNQLAEPDQ